MCTTRSRLRHRALPVRSRPGNTRPGDEQRDRPARPRRPRPGYPLVQWAAAARPPTVGRSRGNDHKGGAGMYPNESFGRRLRLSHIGRRNGSGLLMVPLDHAVGAGPLRRDGDLDALAGQLAEHGADAVVLHKGAARRIRPARFRDLALVIQLNASTRMAPDPDAKYPVATVEEALRLGAQAVSVHVNAASCTEDAQIAHLAAVSEACDRWNVPLLAMMYVRGPAVRDARD